MRRTTIAVGVVAIVMLAGLMMTPVTVMTVTGEDGAAVVCRRVGRESTIALTFTHSMYGGGVTETYVPDGDGRLLRTSIVTANAAAAEYYAWDGQVERIGDRFEVIVPDEAFATLPVRVDQIGDHRLTVAGELFDLAAMVEGSEGMRLALVTLPLATQALGMGCSSIRE